MSKRQGRTNIEKVCPKCSTPFTVTTKNRRKTVCSVACQMRCIHESRKLAISKEAVQDAISTTSTYIAACEKLGVTPWTLYRRMREYGLKRSKRALIKRPDGYWGYTSKENHRRAMERHLDRKLTRKEHVHHIDGDKVNNDPAGNLAVLLGARAHALTHQSLQECGYALYKQGIIGFDRKTNRYFLTANLP